MKLPQCPKAPFTASSSSQAHYTAFDSKTPVYLNQLPMALTNKGQRKPRKKASNSSALKEKMGVGHMFTEHENEYILPPPLLLSHLIESPVLMPVILSIQAQIMIHGGICHNLSHR
jgi:hypothetical protein